MSGPFSISERLHAGLILVSELATDPETPRSLRDISERMALSQGYLEEIAAALRVAGLIEGRRGGAGGYRLCRPAADITLFDIVTALEGPVRLVACQAGEKACPVSVRCRTRHAWSGVQARLLSALRDLSVQDLLASPL